jgi:hypothetical protein
MRGALGALAPYGLAYVGGGGGQMRRVRLGQQCTTKRFESPNGSRTQYGPK